MVVDRPEITTFVAGSARSHAVGTEREHPSEPWTDAAPSGAPAPGDSSRSFHSEHSTRLGRSSEDRPICVGISQIDSYFTTNSVRQEP